MKRSPREHRDGTTSRLSHLNSTNGKMSQHTFITHPSSSQQNCLFPKSKISTTPTSSALLETPSPPITSHLQAASPRTPLLPDISPTEVLNKLISILMEPEEVTTKLWPKAPSPTPESSINWHPKLDLKPLTYPLMKSWISVMQPKDTVKKVIN